MKAAKSVMPYQIDPFGVGLERLFARTANRPDMPRP